MELQLQQYRIAVTTVWNFDFIRSLCKFQTMKRYVSTDETANFKPWNYEFHPMKRCVPSHETQSFNHWNFSETVWAVDNLQILAAGRLYFSPFSHRYIKPSTSNAHSAALVQR